MLSVNEYLNVEQSVQNVPLNVQRAVYRLHVHQIIPCLQRVTNVLFVLDEERDRLNEDQE